MPVVVILIAALILGGVVVVATGRGGELARNRGELPRQADFRTWSDVAGYRPPAALLGYHAATTEQALSLIARTLAERDAEIAWLRSRLAEAGVGPARDLPADDLSAAELSGPDLSEANWPVADSSGADPSEADWPVADSPVAELPEADLPEADFSWDDLAGAGFSSTDPAPVDLTAGGFSAVAAGEPVADQEPAEITALDLPVLDPDGAHVAAARDAEQADLASQPGWSDKPASGSGPTMQAGFIARQTPAPRVGDDR